MSHVITIIERFGGMRALATALDHRNVTTVQGWKTRGRIPAAQQGRVLAAARDKGISLVAEDLIGSPEAP